MRGSAATAERDLSPSGAGLRCRMAKAALRSRLARLGRGSIVLRDDQERETFGVCAERRATVTVHDPRFYGALAVGGSVGAGAAYGDGWWDCDDLPLLVEILVENRHVLEALDGGASALVKAWRRLCHRLRRNSRHGSRRNIAAHYDLGNELFALMLDPTMTYSCGFFESAESSMEEASRAKYERLCQQLELRSSHRLLEIGTGWGGFAIHAAQRYGCHVTTTTISPRQAEWARRAVEERGLTDRVVVLESDYRDLEGTFDRLVSIEMIEAVGLAAIPSYFELCARRLRPRGRLALQAIVVDDGLYRSASRSVDFIQHFIFPGGALPSIGSLAAAIGESDLRIEWLEDIGAHYVPTLRAWRRRFHGNRAAIAELGYEETFLRLWDFYLGYCEGAFAAGSVGDVQLVASRPR